MLSGECYWYCFGISLCPKSFHSMSMIDDSSLELPNEFATNSNSCPMLYSLSLVLRSKRLIFIEDGLLISDIARYSLLLYFCFLLQAARGFKFCQELLCNQCRGVLHTFSFHISERCDVIVVVTLQSALKTSLKLNKINVHPQSTTISFYALPANERETLSRLTSYKIFEEILFSVFKASP